MESLDVRASGFGPYPVLEGRARCCGSNEVRPETWPEEHLVSCLVGVIGCAGLGTWPQTRDTSCRLEEGLCLCPEAHVLPLGSRRLGVLWPSAAVQGILCEPQVS